jgi:hypothetical protein
MTSVKCPQCDLTNWSTAITCKRCGDFLQPAAENIFSPQNPPPQVSPQDFSDLNEPEIGQPDLTSETPEPAPPINHQPPQIYREERTNYQHSGQSYSRSYQSSPNLKSGMAIASMVLGILGFLTSILLIGIIFAPIGLFLGVKAVAKAGRQPRVYGGKGFAVAGIVISAVTLLFAPIVLALAVPNFLAARRAANEAAAITTLKTITQAESSYMASALGKCGDLQTLIATKMLDVSLANNEKHNYRFLVVNLPAGGCEIFATPLSGSGSSRSFFYSTQDGVIRGGAKKGAPADKNDFPISSDAPAKPGQSPKFNL